jgi:hypothetical protein
MKETKRNNWKKEKIKKGKNDCNERKKRKKEMKERKKERNERKKERKKDTAVREAFCC